MKWAGAPRFLLVDPHRSHLARQFIEQLKAQGTTVLVGAAEASWTRRLVEGHGACFRSMVEKMVHDGVPDDMSAQSLFDKATSAKNMMRRIRGLRHNGCLPRNRESPSLPRLMMRTKIMCLTRTSPKVKTMNLLVRFVSEMQPPCFHRRGHRSEASQGRSVCFSS